MCEVEGYCLQYLIPMFQKCLPTFPPIFSGDTSTDSFSGGPIRTDPPPATPPSGPGTSHSPILSKSGVLLKDMWIDSASVSQKAYVPKGRLELFSGNILVQGSASRSELWACRSQAC